MHIYLKRFILYFILTLPMVTFAQLTPKEVITKSDEKLRGESSQADLKMTIIRPKWTREMEMKSWAKGDEYSLILVESPARDKGIVFLKRDKEIWNNKRNR